MSQPVTLDPQRVGGADREHVLQAGFAVVPALVDRSTLDALRAAYDAIIGRRVAARGDRRDFPDIQIWVALDDADVDNGCMQFIPSRFGTPTGAHEVVAGDPDDEGRLLALRDEPDDAAAVGCPVAAGGATIHFLGTPHFTGPNLSNRPRRAYIFNIGHPAFAEAAETELRDTWGDSARL